MEGGAAVDARTFQTEALKIEKLLYHISYAMLRNESDCEDAVQEALLRAWQKRGTLRDMAAFRSWLCRIVANIIWTAGACRKSRKCWTSRRGRSKRG